MWCALPFENLHTLVIVASTSKTAIVGTGVTPRGTAYNAMCFIVLCYYQSRSDGFYIPFCVDHCFDTLFIFWVSCPVHFPHPSREHRGGGVSLFRAQ